MVQATFRTRELTAVVGDNAADGNHRAGYNGLWSLKHASCPRDLVVPGIAILNHEHVFNGETDDTSQEVFFEPRHAPMELQKLSDHEAELHQPPTPTFHVESWTKFTFRDPDVIDMEYRCVAHQHVFPRGYMGLFWASYIHAPLDKSMYFWGALAGQNPSWTQLCTQWHNDQSTVRHQNDKTDLTFREHNRPSLFRSLSRLRFDVPLFYGHFEEHVWIVMFDRAEGIHFTHSPSGGGFDAERKSSNPAWDFQYIVPKPEVMQPYGFKARVLFRPKCRREEILEMYRAWSGKQG